MASSSNNNHNKKNADTTPALDPYQVLGIPLDASDAAIAKAFRKKSLQYHPDKQKPSQATTGASSNTAAAAKFQELQDARDFLQDATKRQKYDAHRASLLARQAADQAREQHMSAHRKRLREQLAQQEAKAAAQAQTRTQQRQRRQRRAESTKAAQEVDALRTQGQQLREQYAARQEAQAFQEAQKAAQAKVQQRQQQQQQDDDDDPTTNNNIEDRQVRLKWSRKKLSVSPSEESLAQLLSPLFGTVERVEFLGKKGHLALITFASRESCTPCVDHFQHSPEMRATYVGARKETEARQKAAAAEQQQQKEEHTTTRKQSSTTTTTTTDHESVEAYKLRRAAEREALLRQMEMEMEEEEVNNEQAQPDDTATTTTTTTTPQSTKHAPRQSTKSQRTTVEAQSSVEVPFPPEFPDTAEYRACSTPYEKLLLAESHILAKVVRGAN